VRHRAEKAEWIEIGLEISPPAVRVENALAFVVGCVEYCGGGCGNSLDSSGHITRIMDESHIATDSLGKSCAVRTLLSAS